MKTFLLTASLLAPIAALSADTPRPGYTNTPVIPGQSWKVHDADRPYPAVVTPAAQPGGAPSDAVVLFDGTSLAGWKNNKGGDATWKLTDGYMEAAPKAGDITSREEFGDCQLHIEWSAPAEVKGDSQGRGNSGIFLMGMYEIQVLDSYQNPTYSDGQAAAIYGQHPPLVNACRKPGEWQSYDILFEAPRFKDGKLVSPAYATVLHNGIVVHHRRELIGRATHKSVATYAPHGEKGPLKLQDHGNPVRFRNIWVRPLETAAK